MIANLTLKFVGTICINKYYMFRYLFVDMTIMDCGSGKDSQGTVLGQDFLGPLICRSRRTGCRQTARLVFFRMGSNRAMWDYKEPHFLSSSFFVLYEKMREKVRRR